MSRADNVRPAGPRRRGPFGGPPGHDTGGKKLTDFKGAMKKLALHLSAYKFRLLAVLVFR